MTTVQKGARLLETDAKQSREPAFAHSHGGARLWAVREVWEGGRADGTSADMQPLVLPTGRITS